MKVEPKKTISSISEESIKEEKGRKENAFYFTVWKGGGEGGESFRGDTGQGFRSFLSPGEKRERKKGRSPLYPSFIEEKKELSEVPMVVMIPWSAGGREEENVGLKRKKGGCLFGLKL